MLEREPTNRDPSPEVLSDQQQLLYGELQKRDPPLAQMYFGAIWVLRNNENPERIPQAAYSMREMMDKLPYFDTEKGKSPDVYGKVSGVRKFWDRAIEESHCFRDSAWKGEVDESLSAFLSEMIEFFDWYKNRPTGRRTASQFIRKQHSASYYPEYLHRELLNKWSEAYGFFNGVLHHDNVVMHDEFEEVLRDTERFLLDMFLPKPTEDFDLLDALIREGEDDARQ